MRYKKRVDVMKVFEDCSISFPRIRQSDPRTNREWNRWMKASVDVIRERGEDSGNMI